MSTVITVFVCVAIMAGLFLGLIKLEQHRDAACRAWKTVPSWNKGQSCVRYHQEGNDLTCVEWLYQQRICMDAEKP